MTDARTKDYTQNNQIAIAAELDAIALNNGFSGNALRVAKDIPGVNDADRAVLDRFATGLERTTDHIRLQDLANRIRMNARASAPSAELAHSD